MPKCGWTFEILGEVTEPDIKSYVLCGSISVKPPGEVNPGTENRLVVGGEAGAEGVTARGTRFPLGVMELFWN